MGFSAFDPFQPKNPARRDVQYVGLKRWDSGKEHFKDIASLSKEFSDSVISCLKHDRIKRWMDAVGELELADPIFAQLGITRLIPDSVDPPFMVDNNLNSRIIQLFPTLSSGHKVVLLTITRLVELVEEKTLVLIDEPEAHLHPPLLSAFIRALSRLLTERNAMAIAATHSPVVLQEVPKSCVWKLIRSGEALGSERPRVETFGENVGTLTNEVFGLDVAQSGYNTMLTRALEETDSYEEALAWFGGALGSEARLILRARSLVAGGEGRRVES